MLTDKVKCGSILRARTSQFIVMSPVDSLTSSWGRQTESVPSAQLFAHSPPHSRFDQQSRKDCVSTAKGIHKGIGSASDELSQPEIATGGLACGSIGCVETTLKRGGLRIGGGSTALLRTP